MNLRHYTPLDHLLMQIDEGISTLRGHFSSQRPSPAANIPEPRFNTHEKRQTVGYLRVDHAGEVCAQALYRGQAIMARSVSVRQLLHQAALEETDHLAWCYERLRELNGHRSYFNILWYGGAFSIGLLVGLVGDAWSLAFVIETEKQVEAHLNKHWHQLAEKDSKTRVLIEQMRVDEVHHGQSAARMSSQTLPSPIKKVMAWSAAVMTTIAYWV
ncbi:MAG: hypothetical protein A3F17_09055 [Gammaproteobacteria bacterium RIFCSPHIGHO2_12_FULL_41_15]|nr:MAG: hypothetical protein A3F17_09055 [Gammaproteobacteria bacterium RIFCSPHIGHO2_12_FULL_41_15]